jgi:hypothetical protein
MSDSDVLGRASKALRDAYTGERAASGFTRARIMNTLHHERRRRVLRWAVFSPLVSLLLVGSAWAQSTGKWPELWRAVAAVFSAAPDVPGPSSGTASRRSRPTQPVESAQPLAPAEPLPVEPRSAPELALPGAGGAAERPESVAPPRRQRRPAPRPEAGEAPAPARNTSPVPQPAPVRQAPADARELALFRAAHDLHFQGDRAREAIAAYDGYLREYPRGRFVPEARYNIALDHIKLGEREAAREALAPFVSGRYGAYRQREASELLDALR